MTDKVRFEQIFFNLLSNAVKFTPEGGRIEFLIHGKVHHQGILSCDFIVKDNGCGMSREFQEKMFLPFEQENNSAQMQAQGTGLGLSIVKSIVDMMGGTLGITSKRDYGTEIKIHLDLSVIEESQALPCSVSQAKTENILQGVHVLLVEDHPLNMEIAKKLLEKRGMIVTCAWNGEECIRIFDASTFMYYQAILMDIRMPVMNGLEATKAIYHVGKLHCKVA